MDPPAGRGALAVEIPLSGEEDTEMEPPATSSGWCVCVTPNGEMARQLLRWFRHKLAVATVLELIRDRPGQLLPRLIRGGAGRDP